jgi:pimeloyl-ACP methyl ester carboxylesterase
MTSGSSEGIHERAGLVRGSGGRSDGHRAARRLAVGDGDGDRLGDFGVSGRHALVLRCTAVGSGPAVVLLHAGGENRSVWKPVADQLAGHGFRSIAVDQRGHGETGGPRATCLDEYAGDVSDLLAWLDEPVTLVGASLGGLASLLAVTDPVTRARVRGVVLVDVQPDPDPAPTRRFLRDLESRASSRRAPWNWALIEDVLSRPQQLRDAAASLDVPVTLVRGGASPAFPDRDVARFTALVPEATVHVVPGAGHLVARDRPEELAAALLSHLGRETPVGPP